ncbi:MAG TPA: hypothetical protein VFH45_12185 [Acidimicrobiales bacterium]|nr:hypothetical protein [Acidimicrobiales bacterium]
MSTLWTPGGERPVPRPEPERPPQSPGAADPRGGGPAGPGPGAPAGGGPGGPAADDEARAAAEMAELRRKLAATPAAAVVANHCYGLFELAALHLTQDPPAFDAARLAIDALALLVEGLGQRLGEAEGELRDGLAQIRLAFVQVQAAGQQGAQAAPQD